MKQSGLLLEWELLGPATVISLLGLAAAALGTLLAVRGRIELAVVCLIVSGVCDLFDGYVARRTTRSERAERFGRAMDGIVDIPSFGLAPVVLVASTGPGPWFPPVAVLFVLCAGLRLAYFDVHGTVKTGTREYYLGVPVTYVALVLPIAFIPLSSLAPAARGAGLTVLLLLLAFGFVLRVPIPKPTGIWYAVFGGLAILLGGYWLSRGMAR